MAKKKQQNDEQKGIPQKLESAAKRGAEVSAKLIEYVVYVILRMILFGLYFFVKFCERIADRQLEKQIGETKDAKKKS